MTTLEASVLTPLLSALRNDHPAVTRFVSPAERELLYAGHVPTGIWVLVHGEAWSLPAREGGRLRRHVAGEGGPPVLLVGLGALEGGSVATLRVGRGAELLHVSRSACRAGGGLLREVADLEAALGPAGCSRPGD